MMEEKFENILGSLESTGMMSIQGFYLFLICRKLLPMRPQKINIPEQPLAVTLNEVPDIYKKPPVDSWTVINN